MIEISSWRYSKSLNLTGIIWKVLSSTRYTGNVNWIRTRIECKMYPAIRRNDEEPVPRTREPKVLLRTGKSQQLIREGGGAFPRKEEGLLRMKWSNLLLAIVADFASQQSAGGITIWAGLCFDQSLLHSSRRLRTLTVSRFDSIVYFLRRVWWRITNRRSDVEIVEWPSALWAWKVWSVGGS